MLGISKAKRITATHHSTHTHGLCQKLQVIRMAVSRNMLLVLASLQVEAKRAKEKMTDKMSKKSGDLKPMNKI